MSTLEKSLIYLAHYLDAKKIPYMIIGGVANLFWGIPRTTLDIDVTAQVAHDAVQNLIQAIGKQFRFRVKNPVAFAAKTNVLPLQDKTGIRIDLIFAKLPYELRAIRRAEVVSVRGKQIRICSPEDLIIHKIVSDRVKDQEDVRGIVQRFGKKLNRRYLDPIIRELSHSLSKPELLAFYRACFKTSKKANRTE